MHIEHNILDHICILDIEGSISTEEVISAQRDVELLVQDDSITHVIVNCEKAGAFHSAEVGWLVLVIKELEVRQIQLVVCNLNEHNHTVIQMTRLHEIMTIYPTVQAALDVLQEKEDWEVIPSNVLLTGECSPHSETPHLHLY